jgi:hypothetical protein
LTQGNAGWCDLLTVQSLEGLAPAWSLIDREKIETLISSHRLLPRADEASRVSIWEHLLNVPDFVPSFATFFKHTKLIGSSMVALRQLLLPRRTQYSIRMAFHDCYKILNAHGGSCVIQQSAEENVRIPSDPKKAVDLAYVQLFLACLREKRSVPSSVRGITPDSSGWLIRLAQSADQLGFETEVILRLRNRNADLCDIRQNMKWERPEAVYSVTRTSFDEEAQLRRDRQAIYRRRLQSMCQSMTGESNPRRAVINYHTLYLPVISQALASRTIGPSLTSFGELALALSAFFASLQSDLAVARSDIFDSGPSRTPEPALESSPAQNVEQEIRAAAARTVQTSSVVPGNRLATSAMIEFIAMEPSPTIGPVLSCTDSQDDAQILIDIAQILEDIQSKGYRIFLTPSGSGDVMHMPLKIIQPEPLILARLSRSVPGLKIFFCSPAASDIYVGKRLIDFAHLHTSVEASSTLKS